ncbi:MAG: phage tail assembly protein [Desulfobacterales bacterium]|nr:phage tail assembly protein [Desulfobacterales bacterium]
MSKTEITLEYPVTVDGIETKTLSMRRPKVRDMLASEKKATTDAEKEIGVFANLCEVSPKAIEELDMMDYGKLQETYQNFLS